MKKNRLPRIMAPLPAIFVAIVALLLLAPTHVNALADNKAVRGYVRDNASNPLENAYVVVTIKAPDETVRGSQSDYTDSNGFYAVFFDGIFVLWQVGDTIEVTSTYNSNVLTETTTANSDPVQYVDITYPFEIDQFGGWVGIVLAAGIVGVVAVVLLVRPRKKRIES